MVPWVLFISSTYHCLHTKYLTLLNQGPHPQNRMSRSSLIWLVYVYLRRMFINYMERDTNSSFYYSCLFCGRSVLSLNDGPAMLLISLRKLIKAWLPKPAKSEPSDCLCLLVDRPEKALALEKSLDSDLVTLEVRGKQHGQVCEQI